MPLRHSPYVPVTPKCATRSVFPWTPDVLTRLKLDCTLTPTGFFDERTLLDFFQMRERSLSAQNTTKKRTTSVSIRIDVKFS